MVPWPRSLIHQRVGHCDNKVVLREEADAIDSLAIAGDALGGNGIAGSVAQAHTVIDQLHL